MLKVLSNSLCEFDPKVNVIGQKAGICDGVPSTSALVILLFQIFVSVTVYLPGSASRLGFALYQQ